jgi:hypothetical protein
MKGSFALLVLIAMLFGACKKKEDVQCTCQGNGQANSFDFGIKDNPSLSSLAAQCDTFGAHNGVDTCNLFVAGK